MSISSTALSHHETPRAGARVSGTRRSPPPGVGHNGGPPLERRTYTIPEAAQLLGLSRNSCYVAARSGQLPVSIIKIGKRLLISKAALDKFLDDGEAA